MSKLVTITIDGCAYQVSPDHNLLDTCLKLGLDLSYFCWHPSLGSVGSCRQCAVIQFQDASDTRGRLIMACTTPVSDQMIIVINNDHAKQFRATNIEALMTNHPHDCPVCEEGGDCHLQDMTLMSGHISRRFKGDKRTHLNQELGPLINHEMNRCIGCYRCVRFYRDYCDDDDLNVFGSKNQIYFGRAESGTLASNFSGNLAEVCPTGVFTDKTFSEHYCRKWDLQSSPTICSHCAVGCNTYTGSYDNKIRRITNRFNQEINRDFICDKGRFSYQHTDAPQRLTAPLYRNKQSQQSESLSDHQADDLFLRYLGQSDGNIVALGSSRSSIENNVALLRLLQENGAGCDDFYADIPDLKLQLIQHQLQYVEQHNLAPCSLQQLETADCALLIGEDVSHSAPRLALSLRQMTRNAGKLKAQQLGIAPWQDQALRNVTQTLKSPLFVISHSNSDLDDVAKQRQFLTLEQQILLLQQIKHQLLQPQEPVEPAASQCKVTQLATMIASTISQAQRPVIVYGNSCSSLEMQQLIQQIYLIVATTNHHSMFHYVVPNANSQTLAIMTKASHGLDALLERLGSRPPKVLIIVEADLQWLCSQQQLNSLFDQHFEQIAHIVVIDHLLTATAEMADLLLPAASSSEQQGCWLNSQGKLQLSLACMPANGQRRPTWQWLGQPTKDSYEKILHWCSEQFPLLSNIVDCQLQKTCEFTLARQSFRASGRTAINARIDVKEYPPPQDILSGYQFSMEGVAPFRQHHCDIKTTSGAYLWQPRWNSSQGVNKTNQPNCGTSGCAIFPVNNSGKADDKLADPANERLKIRIPNQDITTDNITLIPLTTFYDGNELSHYCPALTTLMTPTIFKTSVHTAAQLNWHDGESYQLTLNGNQITGQCEITTQSPPQSVLISEIAYRRLGLSPRDCHYSLNQLRGTRDDI